MDSESELKKKVFKIFKIIEKQKKFENEVFNFFLTSLRLFKSYTIFIDFKRNNRL